MPTHAEKRNLPFSPEQMFDLVADVEKYPQFLPWCVATRVKSRSKDNGVDGVVADMVIGYKMFRERFTSVAGRVSTGVALSLSERARSAPASSYAQPARSSPRRSRAPSGRAGI